MLKSKWDLCFLKQGERFDSSSFEARFVESPENKPNMSFWDFGDGLFVRAELEGGEFNYVFSIWARTVEHFKYVMFGTSRYPQPLPNLSAIRFSDPPNLPYPLEFGTISQQETTNGQFWYLDGIYNETTFSHKELKAGPSQTDRSTQRIYYFLGRRERKTDPAIAVCWRYRDLNA